MHNKKILVTGGLGFIGSHFVEYLYDRCTNSIIDIVDMESYCTSPNTKTSLKQLKQRGSNESVFFNCCISNFDTFFNYDYIINFAAQTHVDNSNILENSHQFLNSNITGAQNLIKQLDSNTRFVQVGTDEVYGSIDITSSRQFLETDPLNPSSLYSSTKAAADLISLSYSKSFDRNIVVTRCCNNFGPRQFPEKLIPLTIKKILNKEMVPIYGTGENIRQWIYVRDHCEQIYNVMTLGTSGEIYNIGPSYQEDSHFSNLQIVEMICNILNVDFESSIKFVTDRKAHDLKYSINDSKLRSIIKESQLELPGCSTNFKEQLTYTVDWYTKNQDWWN